MVRILHLTLAALALISLGSKDAPAQQNLLGELYGMGVHAYNAQDYETAHEYLTSAIDQGSQDPRCYFYRGLTCMALDRGDEAEADFQMGADLEYGGSDRSYPVAISLQRVQGTHRLMIEDHRRRSRIAALQRNAAAQEAHLTQHRGNEDDVLRDPNVVPATDELPIPEGDVVDPFGESDLGDGATAPVSPVVDQPDFGPTDGPEGPGEEPNPFAPDADNPPTDQPPVDDPFAPAEPDLPGEDDDAASEGGGGVVGSIFDAIRRALPRVTVPELPGLPPGIGPDGGFDAPPGDLDLPFGAPQVDPFGPPEDGNNAFDPFGDEDDEVDDFFDEDDPANDPFDDDDDPADDLFGDDLFDN